jgi:hypothetical protein
MEYSSPELVVVGRAEVLVLGGDPGVNDHLGSLFTQPIMGIALGLDD